MIIRRLLLVAAVTGLVSCTPPDQSLSQTGDQTSNATLQLHPCTDDEVEGSQSSRILQCGQLMVAENPAEPSGRQLSLNILRLPAVSSEPEADPLFIFAGGPGQGATEVLPALWPMIAKINRDRDIVMVDQRGTGKSAPLDCATEEQDYSQPPTESEAREMAMLHSCLDSYDADLRFYTTPYGMDDIDQVRAALGYDKINLWGASYGTRAALVYLRRHPQTVRTAILDSVAPFGIDLPHHMLEDGDRALRKLFDNCAAQPACAERFGDLEDRTRQLIARLDQSPRTIEVEHPLTQESIKIQLSGQVLASYLRLGLYARELGPMIPWIIDAVDREDYRAATVLLTMGESTSESISLGMQFTVLCAEDVMRPQSQSAIDAEQTAQQQSILQLQVAESMTAVCQFWPRGELPENYHEPVVSDVPVLLLSGELDPVTPPYWGDLAAKTLSNSRHIVVPGTHHGSSTIGCIPDLIDEFVETASHENLETDCVNRIKPLPPFVSAAGPAMQGSALKSDNQKSENQEAEKQESANGGEQ